MYQYGTLQASLEIERRLAEAYPAGMDLLTAGDSVHSDVGPLDSPLKRFAARYQYNRHDPIALNDLGFRHNRSSDSTPSAAPAKPPEVPQVNTNCPGAGNAGKRSPTSQQSTREPPAKRHKSMGSISTAKARGRDDDMEDVVVCPMAISWFLSVLPESSSYDGAFTCVCTSDNN